MIRLVSAQNFQKNFHYLLIDTYVWMLDFRKILSDPAKVKY